jgi:hypothetical protein
VEGGISCCVVSEMVLRILLRSGNITKPRFLSVLSEVFNIILLHNTQIILITTVNTVSKLLTSNDNQETGVLTSRQELLASLTIKKLVY